MQTPLNSLALKTYKFFQQERLVEVNQFFTDLQWLLENVCESPIEQLFLLDFLRYNQFYKVWIHRNDSPLLGFRLSGWGPATDNLRIMIYPQYHW